MSRSCLPLRTLAFLRRQRAAVARCATGGAAVLTECANPGGLSGPEKEQLAARIREARAQGR